MQALIVLSNFRYYTWRLELSVDSQITGTMLGCQVFGSNMIKNESGSIINISSASAGPPLSKAFAYSVAKAELKSYDEFS